MRMIKDYLAFGDGGFLANIGKNENLLGLVLLVTLALYRGAGALMVIFIYQDVLFQPGDIYNLSKDANFLICMSNLVVTMVITAYLAEKIGKRMLLLISTSVMAISMLLLATYFLILAYNENVIKQYEGVIMWLVYSYVIGFGLGMGPIPWCLIGEIPAPGIKNFILSVVFFVYWMTIYAAQTLSSMLDDLIGEGAIFLGVFILSSLGFFFVCVFSVDTRDRTLLEVQTALKMRYAPLRRSRINLY